MRSFRTRIRAASLPARSLLPHVISSLSPTFPATHRTTLSNESKRPEKRHFVKKKKQVHSCARTPWRSLCPFPMIQEMITDYPPDSAYTFLEAPPSHTQRCQECSHACAEKHVEILRKEMKFWDFHSPTSTLLQAVLPALRKIYCESSKSAQESASASPKRCRPCIYAA